MYAYTHMHVLEDGSCDARASARLVYIHIYIHLQPIAYLHLVLLQCVVLLCTHQPVILGLFPVLANLMFHRSLFEKVLSTYIPIIVPIP